MRGVPLLSPLRIQDFEADWSLIGPQIFISATLNLIGQSPRSLWTHSDTSQPLRLIYFKVT